MNTKSTWGWLAVAAVLFAGVFCFDRYLRPPPATTENVLPGLQPSAVTSLQVIPVGELEIRADRVNGSWLLSKPVFYPAQSAAIETLVAALQTLVPAAKISAEELRAHKNSDADFGFDNPQWRIVVGDGGERRQFSVGNKTAPGDQVFLSVDGVDSVLVTDAGWLKLLPHSPDDWRSTALVDAVENNFDSIVLTNGTKTIELRRDATNHLWRMIRPLQARADGDRIAVALQQLRAARVTRFVTDDTNEDLASFGLQPADLDLWLGHGTNFTAAIHTGKSPTNDLTQIYAKREGWNTILTTAAEPFTPWHGTVNEWRDPHLLELTTPVAEIEVHGENDFTLQLQGTNGWKIVSEKFPADAASVQQFIQVLTDMRVAEFVKADVTAPDLAAYGLAPKPSREIILRSAIGDSNAVIAQLAFAMRTNGIFVHRVDEDFIYSVATEDFNRLGAAGWEFRDRQLWNFSVQDVARITLHQNGKTRQLDRLGDNQWALANGSQGIIMSKYIEQSAAELGNLAAVGWVARNLTEPEKLGFGTNNLQIAVELKSGRKLSVDFGAPISNQTALASVMLDGERWAFVFPPVAYQFVVTYLTIPANVP